MKSKKLNNNWEENSFDLYINYLFFNKYLYFNKNLTILIL
jgi:hypothetical protein